VVRIDEGPKRGEGSINTQPGIILGVQKQPGANTLALTLDAVLDDLQTKLPEGMRVNQRLFRQADFIDVAVDNVLHALRDGGILVILVVLLFLANLRATVITLTAIPLSLLVAILALKAFGASINTMTLGGMVIAIGALVDDAVIDVENVFRRLRENARLPGSHLSPVCRMQLGKRASARDRRFQLHVERRFAPACGRQQSIFRKRRPHELHCQG
jgi:multidrug efflux pump subunit AcrB